MKINRDQHGSAHVVVIIILIIALFAALGVVFYQNFIVKKDVHTNMPMAPAPKDTTKTVRVAFQSTIYALDYPKDWTVKSDTPNLGDTTTTLVSTDGTVQVRFAISQGGIGGMCDTKDGQKISYYNVLPASNTKLTDQALALVEAIYDAEGGGYRYGIGLTQDGGATHAAVGDSHCNVVPVGVASSVLVNNNTIVRPTIVATIEFPKLTKNGAPVSEMQPVKDLMASDDYKAAIKILESARKE